MCVKAIVIAIELNGEYWTCKINVRKMRSLILTVMLHEKSCVG